MASDLPRGACENAILRKRIAELEAREVKLLASQATLQAILDAAPEPVFLLSADEIILATNATLTKRVNLHPAEIIGKNPYWFLPPDLAESRRYYVRQALATGRPVHFQDQRNNRIYEHYLYPGRGEDGRVSHLAVFAQDITERIQAEKDLQRSRSLLNATQELAHVGGWEWDAVTKTGAWTNETYRIHDLGDLLASGPLPDAKELFEMSLSCYNPADRPVIMEAFRSCLQFGTSYDLELPFTTVKGRRLWIRTIGKAIWQDGRIIGVQGNLADITDKKRAELDYRTLFNEMFDGFALHEIITDDAGIPADYRFLAVNPAFEKMTGLHAADIIGRTVLNIMPNTERRWIDTYGQVTLTGEPAHFDEFSVALGKYFEVTAFRPAPGQFACIFRDVTEKRLAEEEKKKLQEQLQQAQKMEAIGTLAGGIAHDFNNILGAVIGYAELAREDIPAGSPAAIDIAQIIKAGYRARDLVGQILAFSRRAETARIPLQPAIIIKETLKMLRSSLPSTIAIRQNLAGDCGTILADPTQIHQILMNLCTNAFHAMEECGGTLTVTLEKRTLGRQDLAGFPDIQPGEFIHLAIADTGMGIAPEIRDKIFDPYFTTKEVGKGTGMGLSIVHGIAKACGGFAACDSEPGKGSVFSVSLPVYNETSPPVTNHTDQEMPLPAGGEHILLVDDEDILVDMSRSMLQRLGYRVTVRNNSLEALTLFQNQPGIFDLVITDQTMPAMTGMDLARRMLQIRPDLPIILCTGYSSILTEDTVKAAGIKGFTMKPITKKEIALLIRQVLKAPYASK
ncbi:MAG: PAS domain S-box protein [Desulforhopalus sp.]|nr:PAS domain S-box protein [Desulforhopalus sp.]